MTSVLPKRRCDRSGDRLTSLPTSLWLHVCEYLDGSTILHHCLRLNRCVLQALTSQHAFVLSRVVVTQQPSMLTSSPSSSSTSSVSTPSWQTSMCYWLARAADVEFSDRAMASSFALLRHPATRGAIVYALAHSPHLVSLSVDGGLYSAVTEGVVFSVLASLSHLRLTHVNLPDEVVIDWPPSPQLHTLQISASRVSVPSLRVLLQRCPALTGMMLLTCIVRMFASLHRSV
jgi:hypothetical protein